MTPGHVRRYSHPEVFRLLTFKRLHGGFLILYPGSWAIGTFLPPLPPGYRRDIPWTRSGFDFPSPPPNSETMRGSELQLSSGRSIFWVRSTGVKMSFSRRLAVKLAAAKVKRDARRDLQRAMRDEVKSRRSKIETITTTKSDKRGN